MKSSIAHADHYGSATTPGVRLLMIMAWTAGLATVLVIAGGLLHGQAGVEKTLTHLSFPIQAAWLLLSGWTLQALTDVIRRKRQGTHLLVPLLLWGGITLAGTPPLGDACFLYLESRELVYDAASDPPLDLLVVLGGGTWQGPYRAEAGESGDRVVLAAQLFLQGHAKRLITTGSPFSRAPSWLTSPAEQTQEIWLQLGIPASAIEMLPGANTYSEMQALKEHLHGKKDVPAGSDASAQPSRVGLLTSAWHLPRAMRLARAAGLSDLIPVAADHEQRQSAPPFWEYLPSANNFSRLERCQREFLAGLINR